MNSNTNPAYYNNNQNSTAMSQNPVETNAGPAYTANADSTTGITGTHFAHSTTDPANPGLSSTRATTGSTYDDSDPAKYGKAAGQGVRGVFKGIHGVGETIRGNILGAVDEAFGDRSGAEKNANVARSGEGEILRS